jgi:glycosyltransferase involved in cell wall biosynthesis
MAENRITLKPKDNGKIKILMLTMGAVAGTYRVLMDIMENINQDAYQISVAYKPALGKWNKEEFEAIKKRDIEIIELVGNRVLDIKGSLEVYRLLRKRSFDIIHCWDSLGIIARITGKLLGCKIIHSHGNTPKRANPITSPSYFADWITSLLLDGVIFCTHEVKRSNLAKKHGFWKSMKTTVIHNCVDLEKIKNHDKNIIKSRYGIESGETILTNIGYFNEQKGQVYLLECLKTVLKYKSDVRLIIVGWGPLEERLKRATNDLDLDKYVIFPGRLRHNEVFEVLSITDIFVLSSLWEGFGIVLAEAMASSVPVVSTDTDGSREVIEAGRTGIVVPPKNPNVLANAIIELLDDPGKRKKMGELGRRRVEKLFNTELFARRHEEFYRKILNR